MTNAAVVHSTAVDGVHVLEVPALPVGQVYVVRRANGGGLYRVVQPPGGIRIESSVPLCGRRMQEV